MAVNNRKRKAADSAEILEDGLTAAATTGAEGKEGRRARAWGELKKVNATVQCSGLLTVSRRKFGKKWEDAILHSTRREDGRPENYVIGAVGR